MTDSTLAEQVDRIGSELAIRGLAARYAVYVDSRDIEALAGLWADHVDFGRHGNGPVGARTFFDSVLRRFRRSMHLTSGHVIDFQDADHATGTLYCRAEHEADGMWPVMTFAYVDTYERQRGAWVFAARERRMWYCTDILERPTAPDYVTWDPQSQGADLPELWPTWSAFWAGTS